jgi:hypothetical protein
MTIIVFLIGCGRVQILVPFKNPWNLRFGVVPGETPNPRGCPPSFLLGKEKIIKGYITIKRQITIKRK